MSALTLQNDLPGILGPMIEYPDTARALNAVADSLLNTNRGGLSRFERELIATYVSQLNECEFCRESHAHFAAEVGGIPYDEVDKILRDIDAHVVIDRRWFLLLIAEAVQELRRPDQYLIRAAREAGATDEAIHDTILIAAAFCMFNRYVEAAGNPPPDDPVHYRDAAKRIASRGYGR